jgi:hypothetical protein
VQDEEFSDEFCAFLQRFVPTVDAAEMLVVLAAQPDLDWTPQRLLERKPPGVNASAADASRALELFADPGTRVHLATLAKAYNERPVTLFRMIYALRDAKIHSFADAFRLRKR